jgi:hypothetical protein
MDGRHSENVRSGLATALSRAPYFGYAPHAKAFSEHINLRLNETLVIGIDIHFLNWSFATLLRGVLH